MRHVVVIGGGYAGVSAVRQMLRLGGHYRITLLDPRPCHQMLARLPDVVAGRVPATRAEIPYRRLFSDRVALPSAEAVEVDTDARRVLTRLGEVAYDWLVLAPGIGPTSSCAQGAPENAITVRSVAAAETLRKRVQRAVRGAGRLRIVVVGGGYTGTELAGELSSWNAGHGASLPDVTVVEEEGHALRVGNPRLGTIAERVLRGRGVEFIFGVPVSGVSPQAVDLRTGQSVPADVIVWAARGSAVRLVSCGAWPTTENGLLRTDPMLRVTGHERIYAAGDSVAAVDYVTGLPAPGTAQSAVEAGRVVAWNIHAEVTGERFREFRPRSVGESLSLGGGSGAAEVLGVVLTGRAALAVERAALVRYLWQLGGRPLVRDFA